MRNVSYVDAWRGAPVLTGEAAPAADEKTVSGVVLPAGFLWPLSLWLVLWAGINTGPWVLMKTPASLLGWGHYLRTALPMWMLALLPIVLVRDVRLLLPKSFLPVHAWLFYGLLGLVSALASPRPYDAFYWGACYLAVFIPVYLCLRGEDALQKTLYLNYAAWIVTTLILCTMVFVARDRLFVDYRGHLTGYGIVARAGTFIDMGFSRSSGMARFAAVPGLAAFVYFLSRKGPLRFLWLAPFAGAAALVWFMQSRGAMVGFFFSLAFMMLFFNLKVRILGITILLVIIVSYWSGAISEHSISYVKRHFYRGQTQQELLSMTGRTLTWKQAVKEIKKSPVIGSGPQADRYLIRQHVHNTYLYALLQGGILGTAFFVSGLLGGWALFFRALWRQTADRLGQRPFLIQVGGILAFFTVRSIPEVCGAMYGVDFMVMLPILAWLGVLEMQPSESFGEGSL